MSYASKAGRAHTSARNPRAQGRCDRCSFWYQLDQLRFQMQWQGTTLINTQMRVCRTCYDTPQQQLRAIVLPADPVPVWQPRPESFDEEET